MSPVASLDKSGGGQGPHSSNSMTPGRMDEEAGAKEDHMRRKEESCSSATRLKKSTLIPQLKSLFQFLNPPSGTVTKGLGFRFKHTSNQTSVLPELGQVR